MIALLKKDYITSRIPYVVAMFIGVVVILIISKLSPIGGLILSTMGSVFIPLIVNKFTATEEMRRNYDAIINSFPVKRKDVVYAKYLYYLIIHGISAIVLQGVVLWSNIGNHHMTCVVLVAEGIALLYYCILIGIPNVIYYSFDYEVAIKYSSIVMFLVAYIPIIIIGGIGSNTNLRNSIISFVNSQNITAVSVGVILLLIGLALYTVIILISVRGYEKRDL